MSEYTAEEWAAAHARVQQHVRDVVIAARVELTNALAAQLMGDDGTEWLRRCYDRLETLNTHELTFAVVVAMSGRAGIEARELIAGGRRTQPTPLA